MASTLKKVISASRRTDIPAFYLDWFIEKIENGYVDIINPFYPENITHVDLSKETVGWIVFWSRNYEKFLIKHDYFSNYELYFQFTINLPNKMLEPNVIDTHTAINQALKLVELYGSNRAMWRFDPIFFHTKGSNYNSKDLKELSENLSNVGIKHCTFSFANPHKKISIRIKQRNLDIKMNEISTSERLKIAKEIRDILEFNNISLYVCCNEDIEKIDGIEKAHCVDGELLNRLSSVKVSRAKYASRNSCGCTKSIDIGNYKNQPCLAGCLYCYANPK